MSWQCAVRDMLAGSQAPLVVVVADLVSFRDTARPAVPALIAALNHQIESKPTGSGPVKSDPVVAIVQALVVPPQPTYTAYSPPCGRVYEYVA